MAAGFIGVTVLVTLKSPFNAQIQGLVSNIIGQQLTLHNGKISLTQCNRFVSIADMLPIVLFLTSGQQFAEYHIEGSNIAELEITPHPSDKASNVHNGNPMIPHSDPVPFLQQTHTQGPPQHAPTSSDYVSLPQGNMSSQAFADPAILSFGKPPMRDNNSSWQSSVKSQPLPTQPTYKAGEAGSTLVQTPHMLPLADALSKPKAASSIPSSVRKRVDSKASATMTEPFDNTKLDVGTDGLEELEDLNIDGEGLVKENSVPIGRRTAQPLESPVKYTGKRSRRGGRGKAQRDAAMQTPPVIAEAPAEIDSSPAVVRKNQQSVRTKGWRQTSLIEETIAPPTKTPGLIVGNVGRQASSTPKRKIKRHNLLNGDDQNGWATEDATDIQDMGEFDFEGNLSKFDKRTVFSQIRKEDTTADEERLVSFNRKPRPGTAGGKNLHHTENVLDSPRLRGRDKHVREVGDSEDDEVSDGRFGSGRSSRRDLSRASAKHVSRKNSGITSNTQPKATTSASLLSLLNRGQYSSSHATGSPRPTKQTPSASPIAGPISSRPSLRMLPSNKVCHCVSPLQMLEVEGVAVSNLGLTDDMMTENAARAIAEVALSAIAPGGKRLHKEGHNRLPTVVILAGNHKSGARAIAGGRHLCNHGVRVIVCMLGFEHEEELLESVRRQLDIFRKSAGRLVRFEELSATLKAMDTSAELIVDALLGMHAAFEDLRADDQAITYDLIGWTNKLKGTVLAVDVPTGLDASTGRLALQFLHACQLC